MTQSSTDSRHGVEERRSNRWRTVDIVVGAVLAVAFGIVFVGWNALWSVTGPAFTFFPPAQAVIYGVWLLPGVLGGYLIRKPGAALFVELVAAFVSTIPGGPWNGGAILIWGLFEGLLPELVYLAFRYRVGRGLVVPLAAVAAGLFPAVADNVFYYPTWAFGWQLAYGVIVVASSLVICTVVTLGLVRSLARTGVLAPFAAGREQRSV
jgi:energy-coupling factor transport system substrate-specific component